MEVSGALNFLGEKQTQSHVPVKGYAPEVSMLVRSPAFFNSLVNTARSYMAGSPPVITTISVPLALALLTISSMETRGWALASHDSFTSHHTHPTSQPPSRIKYAACPWKFPSPWMV